MMKDKVGDGLTQVSDQVIEMFLAGVSTRRVGELMERITGLSLSAASVSNLARKLDAQVRVFHSRRLEDKYAYLFVDGIHLKARGRKVSPTRRRKFKPRKRIVLAAYGVTVKGIKELIAFRLVDSESAKACEEFLWNLYHRGLRGRQLRLIISDRSGGLTSAAEQVYPGVVKQGCWFHKMANVAKKLRKADQKQCLAGLRKVYDAKHRKAAESACRRWANRWRQTYPKAVDCVEKDLERLLAFYAMPRAHWKMVRTTNAIERCFREIRRRTDSIGTFLDDGSISRLIYALFDYLNRKRAGKVCKEFKQQAKLAA
jgi:transposase-like protein